MRRCVFFDRDGVVNVSPGPGYVERWEDFHIMPGFVEVLGEVIDAGFDAVIVTNQRGVARGIMTIETVNDMHSRLRALLAREHGLELLDVYVCPHDKGECDCRKPKPGMLLAAARKHDIDLAKSWMIGDSVKDVEAGNGAGCRTILVGEARPGAVPTVRVADMKELKSRIAEILGL
ncbi:MAG: Clp protease [Verrucomicrobia bacterium]|nr:Clp protease [Verrucomicrobiota bacterium]